MQVLLLIFIGFLASREFIIVNEEFLFILSFLIFFTFLFTKTSTIFSVTLDKKAEEISQQMVTSSRKRLKALVETKAAIKRGQSLLETYLNFLLYFFDRIENFVITANRQVVNLYWQHIYLTLLVFLCFRG
jgi:ABC-type dipeptide/oligopeptide/nickel transport system permease component